MGKPEPAATETADVIATANASGTPVATSSGTLFSTRSASSTEAPAGTSLPAHNAANARSPAADPAPPSDPTPPAIPRFQPHLAAPVLLLLLTAALAVGPGLLPGRTSLPVDVLGLFAPWHETAMPPENPQLGDSVLQFSARLAVRRAVRAGRPPVWDPATMAGHPLAGDTHVAPWAPLHLLSTLWPDALRAYDLQRLLQLWLAGLFAWLWLRQLVDSRFAPLAAALAWQLAGYHLVWQSYLPFAGTLLWLPAAAAAWERAARTGDRRATLAGGLALAAAIAGGQLQFLLEGALVLAAIALVRMVGFAPARRARGLRAGLVMAGFGAAIGAVHLLPALAQARETVRPVLTWDVLRLTGLPTRHLITAIAPGWLGGPGIGAAAGPWRGTQNAAEMAVYVGVPALLAAALVLARRDGAARRLALPALLVAALVLGTPLARPLAVLPVVQRLGLMRWLAVWPLALAPLVAVALATPRERPQDLPRLRRALIVIAAGLAIALALVVWRDGVPGALLGDSLGTNPGDVPDGTLDPASLNAASLDPAYRVAAGRAALMLAIATGTLLAYFRRPQSRLAQAAVLAVIAIDLLAFARPWAPGPARERAFAPSPMLAQLAAERAAGPPFRVAVLQTGEPILLGPAVAPSLGLDELGGYSSSVRDSWRAVFAALGDPPHNPYLPLNQNMFTLGGTDERLLRLLNVRYVLAGKTQDGDDGELSLETIGRDDGLVVHRAPDPLGQAWCMPADAATDAPDQDAALTRVAAANFDPATALVLEPATSGGFALPPLARDEADDGPGDEAGDGPGDEAGAACTLLEIDTSAPDRRVLHVTAPAGGWLVISEAWDAGWRATVDGRRVPLLRAYGAIQALPLPLQLPAIFGDRVGGGVDGGASNGAGAAAADATREIVLLYRPTSLRTGLIISVLGLLAAAAWWVFGRSTARPTALPNVGRQRVR